MLSRAMGWRLVAAALLVLALAVPTGPVQANGTPVRIVLSYLPGVSNFGPQNATGVAELITSEGEARLQAAGLQKLPDAEQYVLWISSGGSNERIPLAAVPVSDGGVIKLDLVLRSPIPEKSWDLMVLTVEAKGDLPDTPSERRAIAGRFSMTAGEGPRPGQLPNTGGADTAEIPSAITATAPASGLFGLNGGVGVLLLLLVVGGMGYVVGRAGSRRSA